MFEARFREEEAMGFLTHGGSCMFCMKNKEMKRFGGIGVGIYIKHHKPCDACDGVHMECFWDLVWASITKRQVEQMKAGNGLSRSTADVDRVLDWGISVRFR